AALPDDLIDKVLLASLLPRASRAVLEIVFGSDARPIAEALEAIGQENGQTPRLVQSELQTILAGTIGDEQVAEAARTFAECLLEADFVDDALVLAHEHGGHAAFVGLLTRVLRTAVPLSADRLDYWLGQVSEDDALASAELALARAEQYERHSATA